LVPGEDGSWFVWRASSKTPLLVYDPEGTGEVTSATQLFGNWTFGGKRTASLESRSINDASSHISYKWENGYEALATLDSNGDDRISGDELAPLALWFDHNQNGLSERGEVVPVDKAGVTALYFTPSHTDSRSGDIHANIGFEREVDGKSVIGASVDWFGESFASKFEAIAELGMRGSLYGVSDALLHKETSSDISQREPTPIEAAQNNSAEANLSGPWVWEIDKEQGKRLGSTTLTPKGLLVFKHSASSLGGHSYLEVPLARNIGEADRFIVSFPINGSSKKDSNGRTTVNFITKGNDGSSTRTFAVLSEGGNELKGISSMKIKSAPGTESSEFQYEWSARRLHSAATN
jgi:hypothetical protein